MRSESFGKAGSATLTRKSAAIVRFAWDLLTAFGLFAVTAMLVCYALDARAHGWGLGFAIACALGSIYDSLQGAWPFGLVEGVWAVVAARRGCAVAARSGFAAQSHVATSRLL